MKMLALFLFLFAIKSKHLTTPHTVCDVQFSIENAGFEVNGTLNVIHAKINFDPDRLAASDVEIFLDPSSIDTGIDIRDKHLKRSDYFDVARFPKIRVQSIGFKKRSKHEITGEFSLTIKSITRQLVIPIKIKQLGSTVSYEATFDINRLDFTLGEESLTLDNIVRVTVSGEVDLNHN